MACQPRVSGTASLLNEEQRCPNPGLKADIRNGEPGGNNIMIAGLITKIVRSIEKLRKLLEPVDTLAISQPKSPE